ncbi:hypothetical protein NH342_06010 [Klenkia sp. PcliD-1-E]|nr:hypothetical protein [Klenkia sp. PcliD-1-E]
MFGGVASGERNTVAGVTGSTLYFLDTDPIGTATTEVKATDGTITRRYQDPYGRPRGTKPSWTSARGYLNAPASTLTNLTHLGSRDYDPALGRFIAVDPLLDPDNPKQNNGYAYGWNNPLIHPDPTGLEPLPPSCHGNASCIEHSYGFDTLNVHVSTPTSHTSPTPRTTVQSVIASSGPNHSSSHPSSHSTHHSTGANTPRPAATASAEPANHCGWASLLCDALGINAGINCYQNPTWGQCLEAGVSLILDLSVVGIEAHAAEAGTVAAIEGTARLVASSGERAAATAASTVVYEGSGFSSSEIRAAESLAGDGRSVTLRAADPTAGRMSDLLVDGIPYDVYTPTTGNIGRIVSQVASKGSQVRGGGVVIDLSKSPITPEQLGNILPRVQGVTSQISDIIVLP